MKLTPFAKLFVAVIILAVVGYITWAKVLHKPPGTPDDKVTPSTGTGGTGTGGTGGTGAGAPKAGRIVVGVNDFGGAYPLILANDGATPGPGSLFTRAGLDVEIRLIRGSKERLQAFDDGEVQVMLLTLDYLANLVPVYKKKNVDLKSFLLIDWSRGNIGIIAKPGFDSIESLKKARITTTRNTPTHYLLLSLLNKSNLSPADIETVKSSLVYATKTPQAAELFQRGEVDAALWEPHLSQALASGQGKTLVTTETATNLIADVLFARTEWIKEHKDALAPFAEAFFEGVKQIDAEPSRGRAITLSAAAFKQKPDEIAATLKKIKPATFADNRAFFGLATEDCPYDHLYLEASRFWQKEGLFTGDIAEPQTTRWMRPLEALAPQHKDDKVVENFRFTAAPDKTAPSLLTKSISIYFASGQGSLDPNARKVVDGLADTLTVFQNAYVQVEGNTDNVGNRQSNLALSQARAESVISYLTERHRLDRARFVAIGNGPDTPVADNRTAAGRELNRRTDFRIIKNTTGAAPAAPPSAPPAQAGDSIKAGGSASGGNIDPEVLRKGIRRNLNQVKACYERQLVQKPALSGRVTVRFVISPSGAVSEGSVQSSTMSDPAVEGCVVGEVKRWKFPRPRGGAGAVTVDYPFDFQPN